MEQFIEIFNGETLKFYNIKTSNILFECSVGYYDEFLMTYETFKSTDQKIKNRIKEQFKNFISFEKLASNIKANKELPTVIKKSILEKTKNKKTNELVAKLLIDYELYLKNVIVMLERASKILEIDYDLLINKIDYRYKDQRLGRINNAFAEVRAVIALKEEKFCNIELCSGNNKKKKADIVAYNKNIKYVIDVVHYSKTHQEKPVIKFNTEEDFIRYFESKYKDKAAQLEISKVDQSGNKKALFFVIDEINTINSLNGYDEISFFFETVWKSLSFNEECELLILMRENLYFYKINDVVNSNCTQN